MLFLLGSELVIGGIAAALTFWLAGPNPALSLGLGCAVIFGNLLVLCVTWPLLLRKKLVALSIGVIVIKFAILVWIVSLVATSERLLSAWFAVGLSTVVLSSLATAFKFREID